MNYAHQEAMSHNKYQFRQSQHKYIGFGSVHTKSEIASKNLLTLYHKNKLAAQIRNITIEWFH